MQKEEIESILKEYGLSDKESQVYLACTMLGTATVVDISKQCRLPKSTCYDVLNSLIAKGIAGTVLKGKVTYFEAADANQLIQSLERKKKRIEAIMPALRSMKESAIEKPKTTMYEGMSGLKAILDDIIQTGEDVLIIGNFSNFSRVTRHVAPQFIRSRIQKNISCRYLSEESDISKKIKKDDRKELRETRFLKSLKDSGSEMYIYSKKIAIVTVSKDQPVGVIIENESIAKFQRILFRELWEKAKKIC